MTHQITNMPGLKKVLRADYLLGGGTAVAGLCWYSVLADFLGLPVNLVVVIAAVTLVYAVVALTLSLQKQLSIPLLRVLIYANWVWAVISVGLLVFYFSGATGFGAAFLILQVVVVGALAWLEGRHITRVTAEVSQAG